MRYHISGCWCINIQYFISISGSDNCHVNCHVSMSCVCGASKMLARDEIPPFAAFSPLLILSEIAVK